MQSSLAVDYIKSKGVSYWCVAGSASNVVSIGVDNGRLVITLSLHLPVEEAIERGLSLSPTGQSDTQNAWDLVDFLISDLEDLSQSMEEDPNLAFRRVRPEDL